MIVSPELKREGCMPKKEPKSTCAGASKNKKNHTPINYTNRNFIEVSLKNMESMTNSEKYALAQMLEVSLGKRPVVNDAIEISPTVISTYETYSHLTQREKKALSRSINHNVFNSIINSSSRENGKKAFNKLIGAK